MGANLAELVTAAAERDPSSAAIVAADRTLSWADLERLVRAIAGGLTSRGLQRGDRVALLMGNTPEFISSYFGILRAGLVAVPLYAGYTSHEVSNLLSETQARLLLCDSSTAATARDAADSVEVIEAGSPQWRSLTVGSNPPPELSSDVEALAVLLFTSGTSGRPKAAMLSHRALLANLDQLALLDDPPAMLAQDNVMVVLPLSHSYALNGVLGMAARTGATVVLPGTSDPDRTLALIGTHRVSMVATAPGFYRAWAANPGIGAAVSSVRLLVSGAAALSPEVFRVFAQVAGKPVWEGYGMTEASPVITSTLVSGKPAPGSVGKPLPGVELELRDHQGAAVADGDPGEVVIRGANLFSGYWPDASDAPDDQGWWATSDIGFIDEEGDLRLVDRRSDMIIVSGFNVYPREVEDALAAMPEIAEVAVMGVADELTGERVKAFVVATADLDADQVIEFAKTRLAKFKCPTVIEFVTELPHSATGKVAKGTLRDRLAGLRE